MYKNGLKRGMDIFLSLFSLLLFSPVFLILIILGAIKMKGSPFFTQDRPGKNERIFKLIKFKSMTEEKDQNGNLLPDEKRLTAYGSFLRKTSLDELPELFNILKGDMSLVGPRPLLVKYLLLYDAEQRKRHEVRPGLTGLAQINGRNATTWEERFHYDVKYVKNVSFLLDCSILMQTAVKVLKREGISGEGVATMKEFEGKKRS